MTPILTDQRKAAIKEMIQSAPGVWTRRDLKTSVEIDPDFPDQFLTDEMADEILGKKARPCRIRRRRNRIRPVDAELSPTTKSTGIGSPRHPTISYLNIFGSCGVTPGQRTHPASSSTLKIERGTPACICRKVGVG